MPLIQVTMIEGRSAEMKEALIRKLTDSTVEVTGAPRDSVRVILQEVPAAHWGVGGVSKARSAVAPQEAPGRG
jgi:4-oxalocrotonate tautomerase